MWSVPNSIVSPQCDLMPCTFCQSQISKLCRVLIRFIMFWRWKVSAMIQLCAVSSLLQELLLGTHYILYANRTANNELFPIMSRSMDRHFADNFTDISPKISRTLTSLIGLLVGTVWKFETITQITTPLIFIPTPTEQNQTTRRSIFTGKHIETS